MTTDLLKRRRDVTKADLAMKLEIEDWHGVADAAMDLREIDAMLSVFVRPDDPLSVHLHDFKYHAASDVYLCRCGAMRSMAEAESHMKLTAEKR